MKNITLKFLFVLSALLSITMANNSARAQSFSNSWINFSNTYYKFRIIEEGIYRITKSQLDGIGMGTASGAQFAIFRDGQEVAIFTSTNGTFGSNDYIEFYATRADGKMDKAIYPNPDFQPNEDVNILTDTAYYFITADNSMHQRIQQINNAIPVPAPGLSPYCWMNALPTADVRTSWNPGKSHTNQSYFYSSDFDQSEGYAYYRATGNNGVFVSTPDVYTAGPSAVFSYTWTEHTVTTSSQSPSQLVVQLGGNDVLDTTLSTSFGFVKRTGNVPASWLATNTLARFQNGSLNALQRVVVRYPKGYNFTGTTKTAIDVPAGDRYLEIQNMSGSALRLYDLTNNKMYTGVVLGTTNRFYLDASASLRNMYLFNPNTVATAGNFSAVQFRNYMAAANQGNYIILSHKDYINATPNNITEYRNYRASAAGGGYQPVVVDVAELYDQFAYGHDFHPLSIKNFIAFADANWTVKPKFMFIVGKGVSYTNYLSYKQSPSVYTYPVVPTWGDPGADNLFSSFNNSQTPILSTGRLSAWNNQEIGEYLQKVKIYEEAIRPLSVPTVAHEFWKKTVLHIAGSSDLSLQNILVATLNDCENIIEDTLVGARVTLIKKNSTDPVDQGNNAAIDSFMTKGVRNISFYGHGSSTGFDYNLNSPDNYNSSPRFPVFSSFACEVAHIFSLSTDKTISERYIRSVNGGSIAMIAGNNQGWTGTLPGYMTNLYKSWSYRDYGKTLGEQYRNNIAFLQSSPLYTDDFMDIHTQCMLFQGDPALTVYNPEKVDYAIEEPGLAALPANVTTALDSFELRATVYSLGKSQRDSVWVRLQHTVQGSSAILYADSVKIPNLISVDTVRFNVPINATTDIGVNRYTVKVDAGEQFDELSEANNEATLSLFIYSENLEPVYPKRYAIIHDQNTVLKASTLNAFAPLRKYRLEIDTTELFNSNLKQSTEITSTGGVVKWKPTMTYADSVVYYWRTAPDTVINGSYSWSNSSFVYLANGTDGWNQSHFFQYRDDRPYTGMSLSETGRNFKFDSTLNVLSVEDKVIDINVGNFQDVRQSINDLVFDNGGCYYEGSIHFVVIDSTNGSIMQNGNIVGLYGSAGTCHWSNPTKRMFEFSLGDSISRNNARLFLQNVVPNGNYIMIKNLIMHHLWNQSTIDTWKTDSLVYGPGNTLYHAIKNLGFDMIDQFTSERVFAFFGKKGELNYPNKKQFISNGWQDKIQFQANFNSYPDTGSVESVVIGPALEWETVRWRNSSLDVAGINDSAYVEVYGVDNSQTSTKLFASQARDISLASVNANQYPYLKLKWYSVDNITRTSPQLDYWRVLYKPVPEAALNAAAHFEFVDSLGEGQQGKLRVAIENLTPIPMDSMRVDFKIIDAGNVKHHLATKRYKKLIGNDTLIADLDFDISAYHGANFIFIEANPDNDQPEQFHPNNLGYLPVSVEADKQNPILDVTFDGIHILDKDIVSAKPLIKVLMRDENKFLALNDTALMRVQLVYPGQSAGVDVPMDGTICKFIPAQIVNGQKNEARVEYKPTLSQDGVYQLIVSGKDKVGNVAGNSPRYQINFTVENKPSITNVLNYPNPFSTSTRFVFTMTGSEIPSQFKIQILSVTGKVVREIKKAELGDLHIGRNMTEYRWDGRDEFGQMLGNGVYLYRVVTSIRGEGVEQRKNAAVDKYFKNGYGKLYIMR